MLSQAYSSLVAFFLSLHFQSNGGSILVRCPFNPFHLLRLEQDQWGRRRSQETYTIVGNSQHPSQETFWTFTIKTTIRTHWKEIKTKEESEGEGKEGDAGEGCIFF